MAHNSKECSFLQYYERLELYLQVKWMVHWCVGRHLDWNGEQGGDGDSDS